MMRVVSKRPRRKPLMKVLLALAVLMVALGAMTVSHAGPLHNCEAPVIVSQ
jgi:hypothetical protein